jgi:phosphatidylglycerol:prolipoprotein diacylglycerol transferase
MAAIALQFERHLPLPHHVGLNISSRVQKRSSISHKKGLMHPILARYGPFFLFTFTVVMGIGILAGVGLTAVLARWDRRDRSDWIDAFLIVLVAGMVGGRIAFVITNWTYYQENLGEIGLVWRGGLSYYGALLAGMLALRIWSLGQGRSFGIYAGLLAPAMALVSAFGWLACWFEGCAYGKETGFGPLAADLPDSFGVFGLRYQTQWMGLIFCIFTLLLIFIVWRRLRPITLFFLTLLFLSAGRLIVSLFRGDAIPMIGQYRLDTLVDAGLILLSMVGIVLVTIRKKILDHKQ